MGFIGQHDSFGSWHLCICSSLLIFNFSTFLCLLVWVLYAVLLREFLLRVEPLDYAIVFFFVCMIFAVDTSVPYSVYAEQLFYCKICFKLSGGTKFEIFCELIAYVQYIFCFDAGPGCLIRTVCKFSMLLLVTDIIFVFTQLYQRLL